MRFYIPWLRHTHTPAARQSGNWFCPIVENLEDRCLPSSYTVNTFNDILHDITPGELTLRDALTAISTQAASGNAIAGTASNIVQFAIGNTGSVQSINVGSGNVLAAFPALTHQVVIDGRSQGGVGYSGPPLIGLDGASTGANADGLEFDAGSDGSQVDGLVIQQFGTNGIEINGASGNLITGNYIGTDVAGTTSLGNGNDGILVSSGATTNLIGGTLATAANVISGNGNPGTLTGNGVELSGIGTSHNTVAGNFIGTDKAGTVAIGNVIDGIRIDVGASDNTIGGTTAGAANVISGGLNVASSSPPGTQAAVFSLGNATITGTSIASTSPSIIPTPLSFKWSMLESTSHPAAPPWRRSTQARANPISPPSTLCRRAFWAPIGGPSPISRPVNLCTTRHRHLAARPAAWRRIRLTLSAPSPTTFPGLGSSPARP